LPEQAEITQPSGRLIGVADHVLRNRAAWDRDAVEYEAPGRRSWEAKEPSWGVWQVPESELRVLPDVSGLDVVELGCGTAYVSAWLARRGARPVGIDNFAVQLANARRFQREFGLEFPLIHADAERAPLASGRFDLAISEYGASIWCDPYRWIPEAARLLRPGGQLVFLVNSALLMLCMPEYDVEGPAADRLLRDHFGMHRFDWADDQTVNFHLGHGDWIRLLRANGFEIEDLVEVRAPEGGGTRYPWVSLAWARRWPSEEIWKARLRG
jgi:SAM-dependent methyltransferase